MNAAWALNVLGLFLTSVGTLLLLLYLLRSPKFADHWLTPEGKRAYSTHRRKVIVAVALLAGWLVLQYVSLLML